MIISHKNRFIYIQNRKVASSSIQAELSQYCGNSDVVTSNGTLNAKNDRGLWNPLKDIYESRNYISLKKAISNLLFLRKYEPHMSGRVIMRRIPLITWNSYYKFCVERNPWDKTLSYYYMKQKNPNFPKMSFDEFLKGYPNLCSDFDKYTSPDGSLLVDKVIFYENMNEGLIEIFNVLNIPFKERVSFMINTQHRTDRRSYQEVYNENQKMIVTRVYKKEIDCFGYKF